MSLILAPSSPGMGVSMAPIVMDIKLGLMEALDHVSKASVKPQPRKPRRPKGASV